VRDPGLRVREVESRSDFEAFFRLPWRVYRDDPLWVPPIKSSARKELRTETNPFLQHCEHQLFILESGGETVGRIAALIDRLALKAWGESIGMFAYFECRLDAAPASRGTHGAREGARQAAREGDSEGARESAREGAALLLEAARDWLRERGMRVMRGPWSFLSQEWGLVVEGFAPEPVIMAPHNPPGYASLLEAFGLRKAKDLLCWEISVPEGYALPDRILKLTDGVAERYSLRMRTIDFADYEREVEVFARLSLETLKDNWGISPITDEEIAALARDLRPVLTKECVLFATNERGEDVGFALTIPDVNVILKKTRGRMLPFGWARLLLGIPKLRRYRMFGLGVAAAYQGRGVDALLYRGMWERMAAPDVTMEVNYVLEDNAAMVNAITKLGARPSRRYRVYEMDIT
jgi:ribosomal protein S18 acetylase RimI-like enzyme